MELTPSSSSVFPSNIPKTSKIPHFHVPNPFPTKKDSPLLVHSSSHKENPLLKPKPRPELNQAQPVSETDTHPTNPEICRQIENLVSKKRYSESFELFEVLQSGGRLPASTYDSLVDACIGLASSFAARGVFGHMVDTGVGFDQYMRNRVLLMHLKCGLKGYARVLFDEMPERNVVSWNTMLSGLVGSGSYEEALEVFLLMWDEFFGVVEPRTFASVVRACASLGFTLAGRQLHSCIVKCGFYGNVYLSCALIDMYSKCGYIVEARSVFYKMPEKTTVGWNSIIAGYALHGESEKALELYYDARRNNVKIDNFTYTDIIKICARLGSVEHAKQAHAGLVRDGFGFDMVANCALVDFYCKWGKIEEAKNVFDRMPRKNIMYWNALINGYGNCGLGNEAVRMFERMIKEGLVPNHVTFLAVLGACSYSGMLDKVMEIFEMMGREFKQKPRAMHYACMVELFGREGLLDEAYAVIKNAPLTPTKNMWAALLTSCRIHKNLELGKLAAEKLFDLNPQKISNYMVLLNIYNSSGRTTEAAKVLETLKKNGLTLLPACSWIEIKKQTYTFCFGDKSHPQSTGIYQKLDALMGEIVKFGFVPEEKSVLPDVVEDEQMISVYHSEKLAIAYGLISTPVPTALQIVQGHRVCNDCHNAIKLITLVTAREITVRDAGRFHHFRNGNCSCGDFW